VSPGRVDPTGKQALFEAAVAAAPDRSAAGPHSDGKTALFSMAPWRPGTVVIECSRCKVRRRASLVEVAARLTSGSIWLPFASHPHWMSCPACGRRQWCRIGWAE
jgi:hypothetical protein